MKRFIEKFHWDLSPVKKWHTNSTLTGGGMENVGDLPTTKWTEEKIPKVCSVWKAPFLARLWFLFTGEFHFITWGQTHAPVSMVIGVFFKRNP